MAVRGKFYVHSVQEFHYGGKEIVLKVVTSDYEDTPENQRFHKYTPAGEIRMLVDNPPASDQLKPGKQFYVDFTEVVEYK